MSALCRLAPLAFLTTAACFFVDVTPALQDRDTGSGATSSSTATTSAPDMNTSASTGADPTGGTSCPPKPWYIDQDNDSWGVGDAVLACTQPAGHAGQLGDCDDGLVAVNPGAAELCNVIDDDCDALIDEYSPLNEVCGGCALRERDGVAWWLCTVYGLDWQEARAACNMFGAELASIHDADENAWLYDQVPALGLDPNLDTPLWLGLRRTDAVFADCAASLDGWTWIDGSPIDWFLGWADGQPDNHPTADGCDAQCAPVAFDDPTCPRENCLDLLGTNGWGDVSCYLLSQGYICRAPLSSGS